MEFPPLEVQDLEGVKRVIPDSLPAGPHVIIIAFQRRHQRLVEEWDAALRPIAERHPGMELWEVPSLSRGYRLFRAQIDGGMRAAIPDLETRRHTMTAYTDLGQLAAGLGIESFDTVHVFLVDCAGEILWRGQGTPDSTALHGLEASIPASC